MSGFDQGRIRVGHHFQATLPVANAAKLRDADLKDSDLETRYWPPVKLQLDDRQIDDYLNAARSKLQDSDVAARYAKNADSVESHRSGKSDGSSRESALDELHVAVALDVLFEAASVDDALEQFAVRVASYTGLRSGDSAAPLLSGAYAYGETRWTCEERATFVRAMRAFPKDFFAIRNAHFPQKSTKEVMAYYYKWKRTSAGRQLMDTIKAQRKAGGFITEGGVQHASPRSRDSRSAVKRNSAKEDRDTDWRETPTKVRRSASTSASTTPRASRSSDHASATVKRKAEADSDSENEDLDEPADEDMRALPMAPSPPPSTLHDECFKKQNGLFVRVWKRVENSCARADLAYKSTRLKSQPQVQPQAAVAAPSCSATASASSNSNSNANTSASSEHATVSVKTEPKVEAKVEPKAEIRAHPPNVTRNSVGSGPAKWNLPTASVKPERSFSLVEPHAPAAAAAGFSRQTSFPPGASPPELAAFYQKLAQAGANMDPFGLASKPAEIDAGAFERQLRDMAMLEHARNAAIAAASSSGPPQPAGGLGSFEQFCKAMLMLAANQQQPQHQHQHQPQRSAFDNNPNPFSPLDSVHMPFGLPHDSNALLNMLGAQFRQPPFPNPLASAPHPFSQLAAFNSLLAQASPAQLGSPPPQPPPSSFPSPLHSAFQRGGHAPSNAHGHPGQPPLAHAHERPPPPFDSLLKAAQFGDAPRGAALAALTQQLAAHGHAPAPPGSPFKLPALGGLGLSQLAGSHPHSNTSRSAAPSGPKANEVATDPAKVNVTVNISVREAQQAQQAADAPETTAPKPNTPKCSNVDGSVNVTVAPPTAAIIPMHTHTHTHFHLHSQSASADGPAATPAPDAQPATSHRSSSHHPRPSLAQPHASGPSGSSKPSEHGRPHSAVKAEPVANVAPAAAARPPVNDDAASRQLEQLARAVLALQEMPAGMTMPPLNLPPGLANLAAAGFPPFAQTPGHTNSNAAANNAAQAQLLANLANALQSFGAPFRN